MHTTIKSLDFIEPNTNILNDWAIWNSIEHLLHSVLCMYNKYIVEFFWLQAPNSDRVCVRHVKEQQQQEWNSKIVEETFASEMFWKTCYLKLCDMILKSNVWIWNRNKVRKWKKTLMNHNNMYGEIYVDYVFPDRNLLCDTWHFILFKWLFFVSMLIPSFLFFWFNIQLVYIWMLFDLC